MLYEIHIGIKSTISMIHSCLTDPFEKTIIISYFEIPGKNIKRSCWGGQTKTWQKPLIIEDYLFAFIFVTIIYIIYIVVVIQSLFKLQFSNIIGNIFIHFSL